IDGDEASGGLDQLRAVLQREVCVGKVEQRVAVVGLGFEQRGERLGSLGVFLRLEARDTDREQITAAYRLAARSRRLYDLLLVRRGLLALSRRTVRVHEQLLAVDVV